MSKVLLGLLLIMPGGFLLVPALLLVRRRWLRRDVPQRLTPSIAPPAAALSALPAQQLAATA